LAIRVIRIPSITAVAGLLLVGALGFPSPPADKTDYSGESVSQLIDELVQIDAKSPGIDSAAMYDGFIADDKAVAFRGGVLGLAPPKVPPQMRELVKRGPLALPELIQHLSDTRPTKFEVGNKSGDSSRQVGVDFFAFSYFSDEYDPRLRASFSERAAKERPKYMERDFQGRYTVKVGDVCFVLVGQIVNRHLLAVRYQPSAGLVVNSPLEAPVLTEEVRRDWGHGDADSLKSSLLADVRASDGKGKDGEAEYKAETADAALRRVRLYFPDTYRSLEGDDLKKRKAFEKQELRGKSSQADSD